MMLQGTVIRIVAATLALAGGHASPTAKRTTDTPTTIELERRFANPPDSAKPWVYWWWLNGYVTKEGITRDLDEMYRQGIRGVLVFHAGPGPTPKRTEFLSPPWRELFRFAVAEAAKRTMTVGLNLCAGWNAGGPWVQPEDAVKTLAHSMTRVAGPSRFSGALPPPPQADTTYRDVAVLAWRVDGKREEKACLSHAWIDLTAETTPNGRLVWNVPEGDWLIVRFGSWTPPKARTKLTGGDSYPEIDPLNAEAMDRHFAATAGVVLRDVKPYAGGTFKYVHIDSGEIGHPDWTPKFREQFQRLRGYDPWPYLAAKAGQVVDDRATTGRFLEDYQRTIGDLMIECYYGRLGELARKHGLGTHSEAAGYQKPTVDALRSLGCNDLSMSEFWSRRPDHYIHQLSEAQLRYHDGIKNASSAAHVYGRRIVQAEAFTVMRSVNYDQAPFDLKDIGDRAFCAGLNRNVLCFFVSQPDEKAKPGYEWPGVGMEFDRHVTWWPMANGWLAYLARCQYLLQQGRFVADVCYFQGEWAPAYVPAKWAMDPALPAGYDCDTINAEALGTRASAGAAGRLLLPDGQSYRYLVLWQGGRWQTPPPAIFGKSPDEPAPPASPAVGSGCPLALSPTTLRKLKTLVESGVTLIGPRPDRAVGLTGYPESDAKVHQLADELWGKDPAAAGARKIGDGRLIWGRSLAEVMRADGVPPDLDIREDPGTAALPRETLSGIPHPGTFDWIHRAIGGADVYFVANLRNAAVSGTLVFRVQGRRPESWDPVTGKIRDLPQFEEAGGRTAIPMRFEPRQSRFVVFQKEALQHHDERSAGNFPPIEAIARITGPWEVRFDPTWGGPQEIVFDKLEDWTQRPEKGIQYYSGMATYRRTFDLPAEAKGQRLYLDLGEVKNVAHVYLNGRDLGLLWTAPWRVPITDVAEPTGNVLKIEVVNLWMNRLIGDAGLPPEKRFATSNAIRRFKPDMPLLPSGLLGPVGIYGVPLE